MTQHFFDFSGSPALTERWATGNAAATIETTGLPTGFGSHGLLVDYSGADARYANSFDDLGTQSGDVEIVAKMYWSQSNPSHAHYLVIYGGGSSGSEDGYVLRVRDNFRAIYIQKWVGGTDTDLANTGYVSAGLPNATLSGQLYWARFQISGTTLRGRIWLDGEAEPGTWHVSATDSDLSSGWVGVATIESSIDYWWDLVGVGTAGESAPTEPLEPDPALVEVSFGGVAGLNAEPKSVVAVEVDFGGVAGLIAAPEAVSQAASVEVSFGAIAGIRAEPETVIAVGVRFGGVAGLIANPEVGGAALVEVSFGAVAGLRVNLRVPAIVPGIRFGGVAGLSVDLTTIAMVAVRFGGVAGLRDGYVGPGTGIVAVGRQDPLAHLREADSQMVILPNGYIAAVGGRMRVLGREVEGDAVLQGFTIVQFEPQPDPAAVRQLARGDEPRYQPPRRGTAGQIQEQKKELDRVRRRRGR